MSSFRLSRRAGQDLAEIHAYIAGDSQSAAVRMTEQFFELFQLLASHRLMGEKRDDLRPNLRSFTHGNYVTFYYPMADGIEVAAVIHGARDVNTALRLSK